MWLGFLFFTIFLMAELEQTESSLIKFLRLHKNFKLYKTKIFDFKVIIRVNRVSKWSRKLVFDRFSWILQHWCNEWAFSFLFACAWKTCKSWRTQGKKFKSESSWWTRDASPRPFCHERNSSRGRNFIRLWRQRPSMEKNWGRQRMRLQMYAK